VCAAHNLRRSLRVLDVHQFAFPNARAPSAGFVPRLAALKQLRPIWKGTALQWLRGMNAAPATFKKFALRMAGNPQAPRILRAVNVSALEGGCRHL